MWVGVWWPKSIGAEICFFPPIYINFKSVHMQYFLLESIHKIFKKPLCVWGGWVYVWWTKLIDTKICYIPPTYVNVKSVGAIVFLVERTQGFQKAPGGCMVTKINRGRDFTYSDNMYDFENWMCNITSSIAYTQKQDWLNHWLTYINGVLASCC